jgi:hypothetical protein
MKTEDLHRHVCKVSGKGMSEGFLMNDETYKEQEDFIVVLREMIPSFNADINMGLSEGYEGDDALGDALIPQTISDEDLLEFSYDNENHLWTDWYQDDLEEETEGYDDDGNLWEFLSINQEWRKEFDLEDYEICGGDGVTTEVWKHKTTGKLVTIPVEIVRDFDNIEFN